MQEHLVEKLSARYTVHEKFQDENILELHTINVEKFAGLKICSFRGF